MNHSNTTRACPVTVRSTRCNYPLHLGASCDRLRWGHADRCELQRLPDAVAASTHLFAMLAVSRAAIDPLLPHWLEHYSRLGIDLTSRAMLVLHAPHCEGSRGLNETLAALRVHGVRQPRMFLETWSSTIKTSLATAYFRQVPASGYLMRADSDEFFAFPCELLAELEADPRGLAVRGTMIDRVAADWSMPAVAPLGARSLSAQYPRRCRFTLCAWEENEDKWMLLPATDARGERVAFKSSASLKRGLALRYLRWAFSHYRFTEAAVALTLRKSEEYSHEGQRESKLRGLASNGRVQHYRWLFKEVFAGRSGAGGGFEISDRMRAKFGHVCAAPFGE
ncbi:hypothetical protein EMIHUDRAFT_447652 [Emiliania huxleyi CCMP1516]|uniref:Hexosyltransferase n=2 Tax=Emiliania huxleyi TaxID=2903 RepID=A0A0D3JGX5_EMIH1|nr:hypothetical protein EMIHUDRAFT_447652 [Emiliania huxleyi CCMP1516]EOD22760.1 hypothetical protein EMIHUDRAFT_447652 [Emiliania huxleyi CCMP1516]|eukprot:XP_005775189.1 hypothetical protein EMIHUDRAFT_447652 [Emiliania huxleyi CCMP1516]